MDAALAWVFLAGVVLVAAYIARFYIARRTANAEVMKRGLIVEGEILECRIVGDWEGYETMLTFRFTPQGQTQPLVITKQLKGKVELAVGTRVPVKYLAKHPTVAVLVPYSIRHDAM